MGLVGEHIQASARDGAVLQRSDQGLFINHAATRHVDQKAPWTQRLEHLGVDQVFGACAAGRDDHQKIHVGSELGRRCEKLEAGIGFLGAGGVGDRHAKTAGTPGNGLANAAQAHDAHAGTRHLAPQGDGAAGPLSGAHKLVGLRDRAAHRQHQAHGQVGHIVGQHIGGVGDRDAVFDGCSHIHAVVADAKHRHHFGIGQLRQQAARHAGLARPGHAHDAGGQGSKSGRVGGVGAVVHRENRLQRLLVEGMELGHRQHIGFGHGWTPVWKRFGQRCPRISKKSKNPNRRCSFVNEGFPRIAEILVQNFRIALSYRLAC